MAFIVGEFLLIVGIAATAVVTIAAPLVVAAMVYEIVKTGDRTPVELDETPRQIAIKRGVARGFVLAGGAFWSFAGIAGLSSAGRGAVLSMLPAVIVPIVGCAVTLVVGWYYERVVAGLLVAAALGVFVFGVIYSFESAVWLTVTFALIGPMLTAAVLFWLARGDQEAFELAFSFRPDLPPVFSAYSRLAPSTS